jgi:DNA-binding GntR family transcriptional regulator
MNETTTEATEAIDSSNTLSTEVVKRIRHAILCGELPPGSKLRLEALRQKLGITQSRGPLREALSRLGSEGLVLIEDQRGYRVAPISEDNLQEIAKLRVHLETLALREAISKGSETWIHSVQVALENLSLVKRWDGMPVEELTKWELAHHSFHFTLLSACGMPQLLSYCESLHDQNDRYRRIFLAKNPFDRDVKGEHKLILDATIERNADLACVLLAQHIERTTKNIAKAIADQKI